MGPIVRTVAVYSRADRRRRTGKPGGKNHFNGTKMEMVHDDEAGQLQPLEVVKWLFWLAEGPQSARLVWANAINNRLVVVWKYLSLLVFKHLSGRRTWMNSQEKDQINYLLCHRNRLCVFEWTKASWCLRAFISHLLLKLFWGLKSIETELQLLAIYYPLQKWLFILKIDLASRIVLSSGDVPGMAQGWLRIERINLVRINGPFFFFSFSFYNES